MKNLVFVLLLPVWLALAGCASNPPLNFAVPNISGGQTKLNAELKSLTVTLANPNEKKGDIPTWAQFEVPMMWESALQDALARTNVFTDDADLKISLLVKILAIDVPSMGASFTTKSIARYELINRATGAAIYSEILDASGEVPMDYAFMGATRMRESLNRSVQNNITKFLRSLQTVNIDRPMSPTGKEAMPSGSH